MIRQEVQTCLEHTNLKRDREARFTASEREWLPLTAERFSREDALRAEQDSHIKTSLKGSDRAKKTPVYKRIGGGLAPAVLRFYILFKEESLKAFCFIVFLRSARTRKAVKTAPRPRLAVHLYSGGSVRVFRALL